MRSLTPTELCEQEFARAVYYEKHLPKWRFYARWKAKQDMRVWFAAMRETMNR